MATILIVDDDQKTTATIELYLHHHGHRTACAHSGTEAIDFFRKLLPDIVILDLMLPGIDGVDVARLVRLESETPIIMLTARGLEEDRLRGFEAGADDYVIKPFSPRELMARVDAVLRRSQPHAESTLVRVGSVSMDLDAHRVEIDGAELELTPTEFRTLETLLRQPDKVFSRAEIVSRVFGDSYEGVERSIDTHLSNLRHKLADAGSPSLIKTIHGVGYRVSVDENAD